MAVAVGKIRMSSNNGLDLYSIFQPKTGIGNCFTTEEDADGGRRKRQRTASPVREISSSTDTTPNSWQDQLRVAAYGKCTNSSKTQESAITSVTDAVQQDVNAHGKLAMDGGSRSGNPPEEKGLLTPPKKMLKVRPDGKLISPKSTEATNKSTRGAKKRSTKSNVDKKQLIVILTYGASEESRKITAQKIQDICSTADHTQSVMLDTAKTSTVEPQKPTHPFFLGPLARTSDQQPPVTGGNPTFSADGNNDQLQHELRNSPRKTSTVNKPGGVAGSRANVGGFGRKPFGPEKSEVARFYGAIAPILPPQGMVHVGRLDESDSSITKIPQRSELLQTRPKKKGAAVHIAEREEVLRPYADLVKSSREANNRLHNAAPQGRSNARYPVRRIMTGPDLQQAVRQNISCRLPMPEKAETLSYKEEAILNSSEPGQDPAHNAVLHVYESIASSLTAFDRFGCETQDWVHKYAPGCAEQVLQQGREAILLRDWLKRLTVSAIERRNADATRPRIPSIKMGLNSRKKRQKKSGDLEGFIMSSDEELDQMDELADPVLDDTNSQAQCTKRSVLRTGDVLASDGTASSGRATNAVVISGPHGCGKTAAVYAVAKELNFEIFEITAGSRRSGKDLLDKVGDMTRNHLVNPAHEHNVSDGDDGSRASEDVLLVSDALKQDLESGRQGTMHSFFRTQSQSKKKPKPKPKAPRKSSSPRSNEKSKKSTIQKQSLILLEEVDVLFEEDKQFWATTLELILQSKRPIIMTCTDEGLLPLDNMPLHAILRFTPPPEPLVTDYLVLLACNEGHLIAREAISALYRCKGYDIRASITELNFFCQMALGDTKGGLEWMLVRSSPQECQDKNGQALRVVSEGTYVEGMGRMTCQDQELVSGNWIDEQSDILAEVLNGWSLDIEDCDELVSWKLLASQGQPKRDETFKILEALDQAFDILSVGDTYPGLERQWGNLAVLDPTQPRLTEKSRVNYVEGSILLQTDPLVDATGLATSFALAFTVCTWSLFARANINDSSAQWTEDFCLNLVRENAQRLRKQNPVTRSSLSVAFSPIASSPKALSKGPYISSFDNTESVLVEEVAPYVRSIVSYDMRLEEQRLRLNSILFEGARNGKQIRTTRASRAALEGGSKANTRREKWFPGSVNFPLVLRTGGSNWQTIALRRATSQDYDEDTNPNTSCQASIASTAESEI